MARNITVYRFENSTRSTTLSAKTQLASSWLSRLRGLLCSRQIEQGEGLLLTPCNSIHMIGMTYAIDAVFLDRTMRVVALVRNLKPWQFSSVYWKAESCLELPAGTIDGTNTEIGDCIVRRE